ncbi:MAG: alpha/beta hydrolase, partial [Thermoleophilia bacterium]|nr:alpha/beta hydrolase [Thermoleophilia bacterium]
MPHVTVNDADLHYLQAGSGDDILLLCGLGDDVTAWDGQFGPLSEHYRVTVIDNRGVGRSSLPDGEFTVRDLAEDAAGLCT